MDEQIKQHRAEMARQAWPVIECFVQEHPQYSIDADQSGSQSVTNYVIFGHCGDQRVIFKYFCRDERKARELFGLRHFATARLVPQLLEDEGARLIVVSHIPGGFLPKPEVDETAFYAIDREMMGRTLGAATANLVSTSLSEQTAEEFESRFYDGERLTAYFQGILQASGEIHKRVDCYKDDLFARSLATIEKNLPFILAQPRLLYHQDALNMHFVGSRFSGFFDLEMCRVGTEAMQIGSLWSIFTNYDNWDAFAQGFAEVAGYTLSPQAKASACAFAHFMLWRSISDYGEWHGEALPAEEMAGMMVQAQMYRQSMEKISVEYR